MGKRKRQEEEEEEVFHVEVITQARAVEGKKWEYHVKWGGYPESANSWEPQANVKDCKRLLKGFWFDIGYDTKDHPIGTVCTASQGWINQEKKIFADNFPKMKELERKRAEKEAKKEERKHKKARHEKAKSPAETASVSVSSTSKEAARTYKSDSDSDDVPLRKVSVKEENQKSSHLQPDVQSPKPAPPKVKIPPRKSTTDTAQPSASSSKQEATAAKPSRPPQIDTNLSTKSEPKSASSFFSNNKRPTDTAVSSTVPSTAPPKQKKSLPSINTDVQTTQSLPSGGGSALSTKSRLSRGALEPINPRDTRKEKTRGSLSSSQADPLGNLSFKKTRPTGAPGAGSPLVPEKQPATAAATAPTAIEPKRPPSPTEDANISSLFSDPIVASPTAVDEDALPAPFPELSADPPAAPRQAFPRTPTADEFLGSIMPRELAAPITDGSSDDVRNRTMSRPATAAQPKMMQKRIPKKFKWDGDLFINIAADNAVRLCRVTIKDITDPLPEGLRLSILLMSMDSLRLGRLYQVLDYMTIRSSLGKVQQLGKLLPEKEEDQAPFTSLVNRLKSNLVAFIPLHLDNVPVAMLLVFSPAVVRLNVALELPQDLQDRSALSVALLPLEISHMRREKISWSPPLLGDETFASEARVIFNRSSNPRTSNAAVHRGLRILQLPSRLADWLHTQRPYCVWNSPSDGTLKKPGFETAMLISVLNYFKASNVGLKTDVRVVFVHVGALVSLSKLPALVERRSKRPDTSFWTYGTDPSVFPEFWGMQQIYVMGGIVTFTPSALLDDPLGAEEIIRKIHTHPLWACFVSPTVLGRVAVVDSKSYGDDALDALTLFDQGAFLYTGVFKMIEEGMVSLMDPPPSPPYSRNWTTAGRWFERQIRITAFDARSILSECINAYHSQYANKGEDAISTSIENDVSAALNSMQMHPYIMRKYRRYVVLKGEKDDHLQWNKDSFEWHPISKGVDTKDEFFLDTPRAQSATPKI